MKFYFPTLGGKQLWTDLRIDPSGWRIQRHVLTGHCRLLDPKNRRRRWGSFSECEVAWGKLVVPGLTSRRAGGELVVLLHGLGRTRGTMRPMADYLRGNGYDVVDFGYASTRAGIEQHALALESVLAYLPGYHQVHFVGHSLGSLVTRRFLALHPAGNGSPIGRVVMLAPPNRGSSLAARLRRNPLYLVGVGPTGQEIAEWNRLEKTLATPREFAVIAGECRSVPNPLLEGAGDLVVTVEETKLEGMADFLCLDAIHTVLMRNPEAMRMTLSFLREGRFDRI